MKVNALFRWNEDLGLMSSGEGFFDFRIFEKSIKTIREHKVTKLL